jgi:hypothetical protein
MSPALLTDAEHITIIASDYFVGSFNQTRESKLGLFNGVAPKFITIFPMLLDSIPYLKSEFYCYGNVSFFWCSVS